MFRTFATGEHLGAWSVTKGHVFTTGPQPPFETPPVGNQIVNLRDTPATDDGTICQTISGMHRGAAYRIGLLASSVLGESTVDVTLGTVRVAHLDLTSPLPAVFTLHRWTVPAPAPSAPLCLHGHSVDGVGFPVVDALRMKPAVAG
jgi:hypothetical protein